MIVVRDTSEQPGTRSQFVPLPATHRFSASTEAKANALEQRELWMRYQLDRNVSNCLSLFDPMSIESIVHLHLFLRLCTQREPIEAGIALVKFERFLFSSG
jgi:hypothetical protein